MKTQHTLILAIAGLFIAGTSFAEKIEKTISSKTEISVMSSSDGFVFMKNGKLMLSKDGRVSNLRRDMRLKNGNVVMVTGVIRRKDGIAKEIHEGEVIDMSGNISWKDIDTDVNRSID